MDRSAARVAIDAERVVEDGVSANGLDAELVMDDAECLGELGTHVVPAGSGASQEQLRDARNRPSGATVCERAR